MSNIKFNFLDKIRSNKKIQIILIVVILAILLLTLLGSYGFFSKEEVVTDEVSSYVNNLEKQLSSVLSKVEGAGNVNVIITVESGMETVIAMKTTTKEENGVITTEEVPILVNGKTVVLKEMYPKIIGVLLVVQGANNFAVNYKLQQATISLLNIELDQIEILTMN